MATRMQQRRGTASEWTSANPILAAGEIGYEVDTAKFKVGDGSTVWDSLKYFANAADLIDAAPETLDTLNELAAAINDDPNFFQNVFSLTVSSTKPSSPNVGDGWLDLETGNLYLYTEDVDSFQWIQA